MPIKQTGGVFGRNPTFNNVGVEGNLEVAGTLTIGGSVITGLNYQGSWNASTNSPDLNAESPNVGDFWIISVAGSTDVGGITSWSQGDWALYDGASWQRVEGGSVDLSNAVAGELGISNGGTGGSTESAARQNLGLEIGVDVQAHDATILKSADIGSTVQAYDATTLKSADIGTTVQAYDADTAKYDDATANFTGTLQNGGSDVLVDTDIGSTVQAYDADTTKNDVSNTFTAAQIFPAGSDSAPSITTTGDTDTGLFFPAANQVAVAVDGAEAVRVDELGNVGIGKTDPTARIDISGESVQLGDSFRIESKAISVSDTANWTSVLELGDRATYKIRIGGRDASSGGYGIHISEVYAVSSNDLIYKSAINTIINLGGRGLDVQWVDATAGAGANRRTLQVKPQSSAANQYVITVEIMSNYRSNSAITWLV